MLKYNFGRKKAQEAQDKDPNLSLIYFLRLLRIFAAR
jgi:hypothetical protein